MGEEVGGVERVWVDECGFEGRVWGMLGGGVDVVWGNGVNGELLGEEEKSRGEVDVLGGVEGEVGVGVEEEGRDMVVWDGDGWMGKLMVEGKSVEWRGVMEVGGVGRGDGYGDLGVMIGKGEEKWGGGDEGEGGLGVVLNVLGMEGGEGEGVGLYVGLEGVSWG